MYQVSSDAMCIHACLSFVAFLARLLAGRVMGIAPSSRRHASHLNGGGRATLPQGVGRL